MQILLKIGYYAIVAVIVAIALLLIVSMFPITGNIRLKVVLSGSMEPAIPVGALVVIKPSSNYQSGDIITFGKDTKTDIPTTHRVVDVRTVSGNYVYMTKGDANEEADRREVQESEVIGKVAFHVPYLGHVIEFAKRPIGFVILVIIPAGLIVIDEIRTIVGEIRKRRTRAAQSNQGDSM